MERPRFRWKDQGSERWRGFETNAAEAECLEAEPRRGRTRAEPKTWERVLEETPCSKPRPHTLSDVFWDKSSFLFYFSLFIGPSVGQLHKLFVFPFLSVTELLVFFCVSFFFFYFKPRYFTPCTPCLKNAFHFEVANLCSLKELMNKLTEWMYKCIPEWIRNGWSQNTSPRLRASLQGTGCLLLHAG